MAVGEALGKGATPGLQVLDLQNNALGEAGGVALGEALGKGATLQLQRLILDDNKLGTRGATALAAAIRKKALACLTMLDVERAHLGAAGRRLLNESVCAMEGELEDDSSDRHEEGARDCDADGRRARGGARLYE